VEHSEYVGRIAIGKVFAGKITEGQPKRFDLGKSGSSPATDYLAANNQTTQTQEQG